MRCNCKNHTWGSESNLMGIFCIWIEAITANVFLHSCTPGMQSYHWLSVELLTEIFWVYYYLVIMMFWIVRTNYMILDLCLLCSKLFNYKLLIALASNGNLTLPVVVTPVGPYSDIQFCWGLLNIGLLSSWWLSSCFCHASGFSQLDSFDTVKMNQSPSSYSCWKHARL